MILLSAIFSTFLSLISCTEMEKATNSESNSTPTPSVENAISEVPQDGTNTLTGTITGAKDSNYYIFAIRSNMAYPIDSFTIQGGSFNHKINENIKQGFYLVGPDRRKAFSVILPDGNVHIQGSDNQFAKINVSGGDENIAFQKYVATNQELNKKVEELKGRAAVANRNLRMDQDKYDAEMNAINAEMKNLKAQELQSYQEIIATYEGTYAAQLATFMTPKAGNQLVPKDFENETLARGNAIMDRLVVHLRTMPQQTIENYISTTRSFLDMAIGTDPVDEAIHLSVIQLANELDEELYVQAINLYKEKYTESPFRGQLLSSLPPLVGDKAPEITMISPNGTEYNLSDLKGNYVLLDFWASWCGPCRKENPAIVKAYDRFKDKDFTIFSVSLDKNKAAWQKAITADNLVWPYHVSDLRGWSSEGAATYKVRSIPANFLLDKEGKIIASSLRGAELERKLAEVLE